MKVVFLCCAEMGIIDQQTRRISAINILTDYHAMSFPVLHPKIAILGTIRKEDGDAQNNDVTITGFFDETEMFKNTLNISFTPSGRNEEIANLLVDVSGILVPKPGILRFTLSGQDKELASYHIMALSPVPQVVAHTPAHAA